ncbi:ABC transporter ATP-binding protein [Enterovibrio baiacu]|uniref:ABC transporter ATP-binding protein n=1 Tax=Enterovibrio baiacu TaxID=2491023 RepID=UPI0010122E72|nr:ABC transporter ATP-binding protein [Enterovibrio baiacu]MBE1275255.1 ATP-binding cassette domain-containing protein [Enterovibrio baiacu]
MTSLSLSFVQLRSGYEAPSTAPLSLSLTAGDHLVLKGASGSGKTSLLKVICGLQAPQNGEIHWQNTQIDTANLAWWRSQFCYLPQDPVMGADTVIDVLHLPWTLKASSRELPSESQCQHVLDQVNLSHALNKEVDTLSGGEKQRLALARAVLLERPIWLMDEPTSALDAGSRDNVMALLETMNVIRVSISHDQVWVGSASHQFSFGANNE